MSKYLPLIFFRSIIRTDFTSSCSELNNKLLMKNYESQSIGSCLFPEVNETNCNQAKGEKGRGLDSCSQEHDRGNNFDHYLVLH